DRVAVLREQPQRTGVRVGLGTVTLAGGPTLGGARVAVPLSLGVEAGGLRTQGVNLLQSRTLTFPWLAGLVGVGARLRLTERLSAFGVVEGFVPLLRPSVRVGRGDALAEVHRVAPLGGRALVGLAVSVGRQGGDSRSSVARGLRDMRSRTVEISSTYRDHGTNRQAPRRPARPIGHSPGVVTDLAPPGD
ncbi:MAG: hypothetical protein KDK70_42210, partial [Myxococcales bacterium]|nr:hypothetical protein [Myxococcales bacterium]